MSTPTRVPAMDVHSECVQCQAPLTYIDVLDHCPAPEHTRCDPCRAIHSALVIAGADQLREIGRRSPDVEDVA